MSIQAVYAMLLEPSNDAAFDAVTPAALVEFFKLHGLGDNPQAQVRFTGFVIAYQGTRQAERAVAGVASANATALATATAHLERLFSHRGLRVCPCVLVDLTISLVKFQLAMERSTAILTRTARPSNNDTAFNDTALERLYNLPGLRGRCCLRARILESLRAYQMRLDDIFGSAIEEGGLQVEFVPEAMAGPLKQTAREFLLEVFNEDADSLPTSVVMTTDAPTEE